MKSLLELRYVSLRYNKHHEFDLITEKIYFKPFGLIRLNMCSEDARSLKNFTFYINILILVTSQQLIFRLPQKCFD
jgi:hypothetical protein